ncbi:MAG: hypothetical protein WCL08_11915, partial [Verrucomicrobiota bacterium]
MPKLPEWNPRPVYLSLLIGFGSVALVQTLNSLGLLATAVPYTAGNATGNITTTGCSLDILLLLPLALGIAWVGLVVDSFFWRIIVLGGTLFQLLLASMLSARYGTSFSAISPSLCLLLAWSMLEWLRRAGPRAKAELDFRFGAPGSGGGNADSLSTFSNTELPDANNSEKTAPPPAPIRANCTVLFCAIVNHAQFVDN